MICGKCGNTVESGSTFCNKCGNQLSSGVQPVNNQSPNNNKMIIIIIILTIALVLLGITFVTILPKKRGPIDNNTTTNNISDTTSSVQSLDDTTTVASTDKVNYASDIDLSNVSIKSESSNSRVDNVKVIDYKSYKTEKSYTPTTKLGILFENNNDYMISGSVYVNYYKNGTRIGSNLGSYSLVLPHNKFIVDMELKQYEEFDSVDITYNTAMKTTGYKAIKVDNSKIEKKRMQNYNTNDMYATYLNADEDKVTYYAGFIFKKDGKAVGYRSTIHSDVKKGDTATFKMLESFAPNDFDDFEVFIQSAYITVDE